MLDLEKENEDLTKTVDRANIDLTEMKRITANALQKYDDVNYDFKTLTDDYAKLKEEHYQT